MGVFLSDSTKSFLTSFRYCVYMYMYVCVYIYIYVYILCEVFPLSGLCRGSGNCIQELPRSSIWTPSRPELFRGFPKCLRGSSGTVPRSHHGHRLPNTFLVIFRHKYAVDVV